MERLAQDKQHDLFVDTLSNTLLARPAQICLRRNPLCTVYVSDVLEELRHTNY